jgi:hypothetical protein
MNKTKIIALVVVGVLVVGGGVAFSMTSKKKRREEMEDNLDDDFDDEFDDDGNKSSSSTSSKKPSTAPAPVADMSKKETISAWKANKADIKSICGRRRTIGKKKRAWLACVKANSGFDGVSETDDFYSFEGNYVEVNSMLTDLF